MEGNDDIFEEDDVLISKWNSESTDYTSQYVKKLSCSIEFMVFMDKCKETLVHCFSDHFSPWNQLCVKFMKNVFKVISLD